MNKRQKLSKAKELIRAKRYQEAHNLLASMNDPTAKKWTEKLDNILLKQKKAAEANRKRKLAEKKKEDVPPEAKMVAYGVAIIIALIILMICSALIDAVSEDPVPTQTPTPEYTVTPTPRPVPTLPPPPPRPASQYTCNCSKTCTQISSCQEAYYQLNQCGCVARDRDRDGIPCETLCGR